MNKKLIGAVAGGFLVVGVSAYAAGVFDEEVGAIEGRDVCSNLDPDGEVVRSLRGILPERSQYSFDFSVVERGSKADARSGYATACFVDGGKKLLFSVLTDLIVGDPPEVWMKSEVEGVIKEAPLAGEFQAGYRAISSSRGAAIYVPCFKEHRSGLVNLTVRGDLKKGSRANHQETKSALELLVRKAAAYAHQHAGCDLPSRL